MTLLYAGLGLAATVVALLWTWPTFREERERTRWQRESLFALRYGHLQQKAREREH